MNAAYKHLDAKLRIAELTVGQWIGVILGLGCGIVWGLYISPFGPTITLTSAMYIAAFPVAAVWCASVTDFDPWLLVRAALRWRRLEGRFLPGPGGSARGYAVHEDALAGNDQRARNAPPEVDLASLWEET